MCNREPIPEAVALVDALGRALKRPMEKESDDARRVGESPQAQAEPLTTASSAEGGDGRAKGLAAQEGDTEASPTVPSPPPPQLVEFESTIVRGCDFVPVWVGVEFAADGSAEVRAHRLDRGVAVDLRHEEAEAFTFRAAKGEV